MHDITSLDNCRPNVLVVADPEDAKILDLHRSTGNWNLQLMVVDYASLHRAALPRIKDVMLRHAITFLMFSRNDQIGKRISIGRVTKKLRCGYSSFSGVDQIYRTSQMKSCFEDFLSCNGELSIHRRQRVDGAIRCDRYPEPAAGTFSVALDVEQLGDKYALPRLLELFKAYRIRATFFLTNVVTKVYGNIAERIEREGHEIGLHGNWHEYLADSSLEDQETLIRHMMSQFKCKIHGANFIGRWNSDTVRAMAANRLTYFVVDRINRYRRYAYPRSRISPNLLEVSGSRIWMLPIGVETYNLRFFSIRNMLDSAMSQARKEGFSHITVLLHPFADGNLARIKTTETTLRYLIQRGLEPLTLRSLVNKISEVDWYPGALSGAREDEMQQMPPLPTFRDLLAFIPENGIRFAEKLRGKWPDMFRIETPQEELRE